VSIAKEVGTKNWELGKCWAYLAYGNMIYTCSFEFNRLKVIKVQMPDSAIQF